MRSSREMMGASSMQKNGTAPAASPRALGRSLSRFSACLTAAERARSEEHTSELQSPYDLLCRLLLEKKNKKKHSISIITSRHSHNALFLILLRPHPHSTLFPYTTLFRSP